MNISGNYKSAKDIKQLAFFNNIIYFQHIQ